MSALQPALFAHRQLDRGLACDVPSSVLRGLVMDGLLRSGPRAVFHARPAKFERCHASMVRGPDADFTAPTLRRPPACCAARDDGCDRVFGKPWR